MTAFFQRDTTAVIAAKTGSAQRFPSTHAATYNTFNVQRHLTSARTHRAFRESALETWREVVAAA
jgi:putative transposase